MKHDSRHVSPMKRTLSRRSAVISSARDQSDDRVTESGTSHLALHPAAGPEPREGLIDRRWHSERRRCTIDYVSSGTARGGPPSTRPVCARPYALPRAEGGGVGRLVHRRPFVAAFVRPRSFIGACSTRTDAGQEPPREKFAKTSRHHGFPARRRLSPLRCVPRNVAPTGSFACGGDFPRDELFDFL